MVLKQEKGLTAGFNIFELVKLNSKRLRMCHGGSEKGKKGKKGKAFDHNKVFHEKIDSIDDITIPRDVRMV